MRKKPRANIERQKTYLLERFEEGDISADELLLGWETALMMDYKHKANLRIVSNSIYLTIFVVYLLIFTFERDSYSIEPDSHDIVWVKKTWWGLRDVQHPVKWSGKEWRAKSESGEWYSFFIDYDEPESDGR